MLSANHHFFMYYRNFCGIDGCFFGVKSRKIETITRIKDIKPYKMRLIGAIFIVPNGSALKNVVSLRKIATGT